MEILEKYVSDLSKGLPDEIKDSSGLFILRKIRILSRQMF